MKFFEQRPELKTKGTNTPMKKSGASSMKSKGSSPAKKRGSPVKGGGGYGKAGSAKPGSPTKLSKTNY